MLTSKFDLYKPEWLELVFNNRNKAYGAYQLRQHNSRTMVFAMTITFAVIGAIFGVSAFIQSQRHVGPAYVYHEFHLAHPGDLPKKLPPPIIPRLPKPPPVATIKFIPPVVKPDNLAQEPPKIEDLNVAISTTTTKGPPGDPPLPTVDVNNGPASVTEDDKVHPLYEVEVMPAPVGGEAAWSKFLNKNLAFPNEAQQDGVGGRVMLSFIVEKDGTLTNFTVDRPAGHGFDEEALRVLKLAKAWKPGIQNGHPVRVRFTIPINFTVNDPN